MNQSEMKGMKDTVTVTKIAATAAGTVGSGVAASTIGSAVSGASGAALVASAALGPIGLVAGAVLGAGVGAYLAARTFKRNKSREANEK